MRGELLFLIILTAACTLQGPVSADEAGKLAEHELRRRHGDLVARTNQPMDHRVLSKGEVWEVHFRPRSMEGAPRKTGGGGIVVVDKATGKIELAVFGQ